MSFNTIINQKLLVKKGCLMSFYMNNFSICFLKVRCTFTLYLSMASDIVYAPNLRRRMLYDLPDIMHDKCILQRNTLEYLEIHTERHSILIRFFLCLFCCESFSFIEKSKNIFQVSTSIFIFFLTWKTMEP